MGEGNAYLLNKRLGTTKVGTPAWPTYTHEPAWPPHLLYLVLQSLAI